MSFIYIPNNLDLKPLLEKDPIEAHIDRVYLIVYKYFQAYLFDRYARTKDGYVYINASRFKDLASNYKIIIDWLEKHEIFEINKSYTETVHPRKYKVPLKYTTGLIPYEITDKTTQNAVNNHLNSVDDKTKKKYSSLWKDIAKGDLAFHTEVDSILLELYKKDKLEKSKQEALLNRSITQISLFKIKNNEIWFYQDLKGNRLHTNLTNLNSAFRENLRYKGEKLIEIDIKNSQPYFSISILIKYYSSITIPESTKNPLNKGIEYKENKCFMNYVSKVLDGTIYDYFEEKYKQAYGEKSITEFVTEQYNKRLLWSKMGAVTGGIAYGKRGFRPNVSGKSSYVPQDMRGKTNRQIVKTMIFSVLYGDLESKNLSKHKKLFRALFPTIWELLFHIKRETENFAVELQKQESKAILDTVAPKIKKHNYRIPLFTIHDCLITTEKHAEYVEGVLKEELTTITGYEPKLNVRPWT